MKSIKGLSIAALSFISLNVFAMSDSGVAAKAAKDIQEVIMKIANIEGCDGNLYLDEKEFSQRLAGLNVATIQDIGGGGSMEGSGSNSEIYSGAIVVPAAEAYSSSAHALDGKAVSQVFGFSLVISRKDCSKTKTTGELSLFRSKSDKLVTVSKFTIKD